jgi:hypothetical protein
MASAAQPGSKTSLLWPGQKLWPEVDLATRFKDGHAAWLATGSTHWRGTSAQLERREGGLRRDECTCMTCTWRGLWRPVGALTGKPSSW